MTCAGTWGRDTNLRSEPTLDAGLFEGRIGEALIFAALGRTLGQSRFADAAELTIGPLRQRLRLASECEAIVTQNGFGLMGLGSMIYALVRIAAYLDSAHILEDARRAVRNLTAGTIPSDDRFEFFRGVAGLILGLVAVADTGDASRPGSGPGVRRTSVEPPCGRLGERPPRVADLRGEPVRRFRARLFRHCSFAPAARPAH